MPQSDQDVVGNGFDEAFASFTGKPTDPLAPPVTAEAPAEPAPAPAPAAEPAAEVDELKRQLAEALHRERSSANRMSERDRQNNELSRQVQELMAQVRQLQEVRPAPAPAASDEPDLLDGADDLRSAVERRVQREVEPLRAKLTDAEKRAQSAEAAAQTAAKAVEPLIQEREARALDELGVKLDESFTGWRDAIKTPQFRDWLEAVPQEIRAMYQTAGSFDKASRVLRLYAADTGHQFQRKAAGDETQPPGGLRAAVGIRPGVAGVHARPDPNDFEGAFSEFAQRRSAA